MNYLKKNYVLSFLLFIAILSLLTFKVYAADSTIKISEVGYVTPEMYGAVGDGTTDDTKAIVAAIKTGSPVKFSKKYVLKSRVFINKNCYLFGKGTILVQNKEATVFQMTTTALDYFVVKDLHFIMTEGISKERQQNLFYSGVVNLKLMQLENISVEMYGENGYVLTSSSNVSHYIFNGVKVKNQSTNSLGGCIWINSEVNTLIEIDNCSFTQTPKDEILSIACTAKCMDISIKCYVNNSAFKRLTNSNVSRGFSLRGWCGTNNYMKFTDCTFVMANDDNMLTMSGKGTLVEMDNCTITGNPLACVFGGYDTFDKPGYDYIVRNSTIETKSAVAGNYEHSTRMASPNILFENCNIKGKTLVNIRNDSSTYQYLSTTIDGCNIEVTDVIRTQGMSIGNLCITNSDLRFKKSLLSMSTAGIKASYPLTQDYVISNNILNGNFRK